MKRRRVPVKWILAAGIAVLLLMLVNHMWIDTGFAARGYVKFHYGDKAIDTVITDADLRTLKGIFHGFAHWEPGIPSCGFDAGVSVTLTDGRRSITFCPACDGCAKFRIGDSNRYLSVSKEQRRLFEATVKEYGMTFPCV